MTSKKKKRKRRKKLLLMGLRLWILTKSIEEVGAQ